MIATLNTTLIGVKQFIKIDETIKTSEIPSQLDEGLVAFMNKVSTVMKAVLIVMVPGSIALNIIL